MLTAIDLIARCESGCKPLGVDRGVGKRFTAVADSWRTRLNILISSSHAFLRRFITFFRPSRTRAGERGWQNVISSISQTPWLPIALISGRSEMEDWVAYTPQVAKFYTGKFYHSCQLLLRLRCHPGHVHSILPSQPEG